MKQILLFIYLIMAAVLPADTVYAEPIPSFIEPRKVIFSMTGSSEEEINHILSSANNVLKAYGPENVEMRIVAYYHGIRGLLKINKDTALRVKVLMQYNVEFIACGNTMKTKKIDKSELIEGTEIVTAGIVEMIERVQEGWVYIKP